MDSAIEVVLKEIEAAEEALVYPARPEKPTKDEKESNAAYGARLDVYEEQKHAYRVAVENYRDRLGTIGAEFKTKMAKALGIADHPKAKLLMQIAWEHGHSSGYREVAIYAEELAELLR